jgi:hypothetical protein
MEVSPSPLSSRAKPRDLRLYGPFLEMFFTDFSIMKNQINREGKLALLLPLVV